MLTIWSDFAFSRAILIEKFDPTAYYNSGFTMMKLNNYKIAIFDYSKSIEINIDDADGYLNRVLIYF